MTELQTLQSIHLAAVTGGADPAPQPPPAKPAPQGGGNLDWIRNTINCARIGGPVLGAICGILTPSPAY